MSPRERLFALEQFGIKLGLDNIATIVDALGRPDRTFRSVHVAGTNGKGSVTAMVERGLRAAGHRTGRYTSPHLLTIEERVAVDGAPADPATFDAVTADVLARVDRLVAERQLEHLPTFFEAVTAIALEVFTRAHVSTAVIEVGLGGRFDATNVITPMAAAITTIDFDHERHLGSTLEQIAFEKAGIIKPRIPVVLGEMPRAARNVIEQVARQQEAPIVEARLEGHGTEVPLALHGEHQQQNAAVAVELLRLCEVPRDAMLTALTDVEWPARLEWLRLPDGCDLLVDAAHNPSGARALAAYVTARRERLPIILGIMRDKNVEAILRELLPAASRFLTVTVDSPRSLTANELAAAIARVAPGTPCRAFTDADAAVRDACGTAARAVMAGSIFLVGPERARLLAQGAVPVRYPSEASRFFLC